MNKILDRKVSARYEIIIRQVGSEIQMVFHQPKSDVFEIQAEMDVGRPDYLLARYTQAMVGALVWQPDPKNVLFCGLGGGRLATVLHSALQEAHMTAIEIDADVVSLARKHFGISEGERLRIEIADCREYLARLPDEVLFDAVFVDTFQGDGREPKHLITQEFFELCGRHLTKTGVICINSYPMFPNYYNQIRTLADVFRHVALVPAGGNTILIGFNFGETGEKVIQREGWDLQRRYGFLFPVAEHISQIQFADKILGANVLRDG